MNPEQELSKIADLLMVAAASHAGKVYVCLRNKELVVVSDTARGAPLNIVMTFRAEEIRQGLTVDEWTRLRRKIAKAMQVPR